MNKKMVICLAIAPLCATIFAGRTGVAPSANSRLDVLAKKSAAAPSSRYAGMKKISTGGASYLMGFATGADNSWSCVMGQHKVTFTHDIYVDTTLVTQTDFKALMGFNPSGNTSGLAGLPVDQETWYDAVLYCNARSKRDGLDTVYSYTARTLSGQNTVALTGISDTDKILIDGYRLPTNAEQEYLKGAGTTSTYFWGEDAGQASTYAWYSDNSGGQTHPVAQKKPNSLGLYDITGNCFQWAGDWDSTYLVKDQIDPRGPMYGTLKDCGPVNAPMIARCAGGGSFSSDASAHERIRYHFKWTPNGTGSYIRELGFRCVATIMETPILEKSNSSGMSSSCNLDKVIRLASGDIQLSFRTTTVSAVRIACYNALGTLMGTAVISNPRAGSNEFVVKFGLSSGMNFIRLAQGGITVTGKVIVINK
ncbi:MAG: SUMF1/EgtB/PvdO family nonheme iron enzyme [Chitinivibrionales bacterium]